jgi:hypothetical protein
MRSNGSDCPTLCIPPLLRGCGKINGPNVLLGLGIYDPDFLIVHGDRGRKGEVCNALVTSINLTVVNGYGSPNEISFVDLLHIPTCYPRYLGITRRSCLEAHMVLDMEYREQERLEHGPGGPIFLLLSQTCPVSSTSFHHYRPGLASERTLAP